jgi:hypothetical protein
VTGAQLLLDNFLMELATISHLWVALLEAITEDERE